MAIGCSFARREMEEKFMDAKVQKPVDVRHVYGGVLYFNPSDSALFVSKYILKFCQQVGLGFYRVHNCLSVAGIFADIARFGKSERARR
jgi:hypothetical protein